MSTKRKRTIVWGGTGLFILYNIISGGGCVIEKTDSLAVLGEVAKAQLTDDASVYLKQSPTRKRFIVPFVFYYYHNTYPFRLRFYGSTRDGSVHVSDREIPAAGTNVVVTEVRYHRRPEDARTHADSHVFETTSWSGISIPEPGEWIVESKGYVKTEGEEKKPLTFPTMTIRETEHGRIRVSGFLNYVLSNMP